MSQKGDLMRNLDASDIMCFMVDEGYAPPYIELCMLVGEHAGFFQYEIQFIDEMDIACYALVFVRPRDNGTVEIVLGQVHPC